MWEKFKAWLGIAQRETSEAFQAGEDAIKEGFKHVDAVAHKASDAIQHNPVTDKLNEWGKEIGGKRAGPPRMDIDRK